MRWILPSLDAAQAERLAAALSIDSLAARVLVARGLGDPAAAAHFLSDALGDLPDPFTMLGMRPAVDRLARAVRSGERVTLYGDYDVDGVCSTALLSLFLEACGARVATAIPHRLRDGYGLNHGAVERIAGDGTRVLVTLDCGITAAAEVARARDLGLDVVVVDHHTVPAVLPPALAVLNPHQEGCGYPTRHLCAAGVAFALCMALRRALREAGQFRGRAEPNLRALLDLVALATVADVVPLTGANRILVRHGLHALTRAERPGIRALKEVAGMAAGAAVTSGLVGFRLGPRINAAGRLDDASVGLQLLRAPGLDEARPLARALDASNQERQLLEQKILASALEQAETRGPERGLVLWGEDWHPGVVGIVAARVVDRLHRPVVVVGVQEGVGKGSARSIERFHLVEALGRCAEHLTRYGGHRAAAGVTLEARLLPAFREAFARVASEVLTAEDLERRCQVDAVVDPEELTEGAVQGLAALGPFGQGNPEPVLIARGLAARARVLAAKRGGAGHLKLVLPDAPRLDAIGFGMAERAGETRGRVDLAFQATVDEFRGQRRVALRLKDLRAAS
ncbi:MAG TPA: single-stranded-DNA-specific exonuclease RecJ [Myxococcaceae bacterium]|nr:single-stranded-DNA-specific exonuclease RecJ [Myxococcaceae bacterium]